MGYEGGPPLNSGIMHTDAFSGILAAGAAVTALRLQQKTGLGQCVEVSQQEATLSLLAEYIMEYSLTGNIPGRQENFTRNVAPQGCYLSLDGIWIALTVKDETEWIEFQNILGNPYELTDTRFLNLDSRHRYRFELDESISKVVARLDSRQFTDTLRSAGIPCEPVSNLLQVATSDDLHELGMFVGVDHPGTGSFYHVSPPWDFSVTPASIRMPAPTLGQHTNEVLRERLGWSEKSVQKLFDTGIIGTDPVT
jgi:crotonobetainyl-CoA:carnitine CoA-transferase CaiB-like acyl-CoA transferase